MCPCTFRRRPASKPTAPRRIRTWKKSAHGSMSSSASCATHAAWRARARPTTGRNTFHHPVFVETQTKRAVPAQQSCCPVRGAALLFQLGNGFRFGNSGELLRQNFGSGAERAGFTVDPAVCQNAEAGREPDVLGGGADLHLHLAPLNLPAHFLVKEGQLAGKHTEQDRFLRSPGSKVTRWKPANSFTGRVMLA